MSKALRRKQALKQSAELAKLERKLVREGRKVLGTIKSLAIKYQSRFNLRQSDLRKLQDIMTKGKVVADLTAKRSVQREMGKKVLKLSVIDDILDLYGNATEEAVADLVAYYEPSTLNVISNLTTRLDDGVRDALAEAIRSQVSPKAAIQSFFENLGLSDTNAYYFENLLRTQTQLAYSAARWEEYQSPEISEIIWGYQYITVGDDRVRENHAELDGVTLPKDDPFWRSFFPPNGYNCRCTAIPIFEKESVKSPPKDATTDEGFNFNPADLVRRL